jgi:hypothetical protein
MPQAANITVKNGAGTPVDKIFTLYGPAAGDGSIAKWALKEGLISSVFPTFTASARQSGNQGRNLQLKLRIPSSYTDSVTGLTKVGSAFEANVAVAVPDDFPEALKNDAVAFTANLLNHALVKELIRDALPAT